MYNAVNFLRRGGIAPPTADRQAARIPQANLTKGCQGLIGSLFGEGPKRGPFPSHERIHSEVQAGPFPAHYLDLIVARNVARSLGSPADRQRTHAAVLKDNLLTGHGNGWKDTGHHLKEVIDFCWRDRGRVPIIDGDI